MTYRFIDSHVNLHAAQFHDENDLIIARALEAGVGLMVNISDKLSHFDAVYRFAEEHDFIWATAGTHPHEAKENPELKAQDILDFCQRPKVVGIGECGLDYYYNFSPKEIQIKIFQQHIIASQESELPLIIHSRDADDDMLSLLKEAIAHKPFRFLLHCYTSEKKLAQWAAEEGGYFSVSGIATFKSATLVREIIRSMPDERILIETDCPYLAPIPMRGRRNEPAFIGHIYQCLADIKGWTLEDTQIRAHTAFFNLFDRIKGEGLYYGK